MKRTAFLRKTPGEARLTVSIPKPPKPKKCPVCKEPFQPERRIQKVCSGLCGQTFARRKRELEAAKLAALERKGIREKLEALKTRKEVEADVQVAFNRYIRLRDAGRPCICCGKPMEPDRPGGSIDAGHYLSRGSACNLRFDESNVHAQRKNCNRPGGTTRAAFRAGMVDRIGIAEVERLEADQTPRKFDIDTLREMRSAYRAKAKGTDRMKHDTELQHPLGPAIKPAPPVPIPRAPQQVKPGIWQHADGKLETRITPPPSSLEATRAMVADRLPQEAMIQKGSEP